MQFIVTKHLNPFFVALEVNVPISHKIELFWNRLSFDRVSLQHQNWDFYKGMYFLGHQRISKAFDYHHIWTVDTRLWEKLDFIVIMEVYKVFVLVLIDLALNSSSQLECSIFFIVVSLVISIGNIWVTISIRLKALHL